MFTRIKEIYLAKLELAKLEGVDKASSVLAKLVTLGVVSLLVLMMTLALLILLSVLVGYIYSSSLASILTFGTLIMLSSGIVILFRQKLIFNPIKNVLIKEIYDDIS